MTIEVVATQAGKADPLLVGIWIDVSIVDSTPVGSNVPPPPFSGWTWSFANKPIGSVAFILSVHASPTSFVPDLQGAYTLVATDPNGGVHQRTFSVGAAPSNTSSALYTQASPLASGVSYALNAMDGVLYVAAGALVVLPADPLPGREYLVKVVQGAAETAPVLVTAGGGYPVEDPGAASNYVMVTGTTPATIKNSGACRGWTFDGAAMNLTR